jgi:hypothetical protein
MKLLSIALFLSVLTFLSSCNQKHIEAKRQGLIPVQEQVAGHFGLEAKKLINKTTPTTKK